MTNLSCKRWSGFRLNYLTILDYNRFLNNYTIYSFPIYRDSRFDKNNKYINISGQGIDDDDSKAIIIWRKKSNINLKINSNFLEVSETY